MMLARNLPCVKKYTFGCLLFKMNKCMDGLMHLQITVVIISTLYDKKKRLHLFYMPIFFFFITLVFGFET